MNDKINEKLDNFQKIIRFIIDIIFLIFMIFLFISVSKIEKILILPLLLYFVGRIFIFFKRNIGNKISTISMTLFIIEIIIYFIYTKQ